MNNTDYNYIKVHILNPAAGQGGAMKYQTNNSDEIVYITKNIGDAESFVYEMCVDNPRIHFIVYGGDGTINEVVNGIMNAGTNDITKISINPVGTGNDFIRNFKSIGDYTVDVMKYNGRYSVNIVNIGFDCDVVEETGKLKKLPLISGSLAYVIGVAKVLFRPLGKKIKMKIIDNDNNELHYDGTFLLAAIANGAYYGGGFHAAPLSSLTDGLLDVLIINKMSRLKFLSLVGDYKNGTHMNKETNQPIEKFKKVIDFYRCRFIKIENIDKFCADGEIYYSSSLEIEIICNAITLTTFNKVME